MIIADTQHQDAAQFAHTRKCGEYLEAFFSSAVVVGPNNARVEVLDIDNVYPDVFCEFFNRDIDSLVH